jgi:cyanophycinase
MSTASARDEARPRGTLIVVGGREAKDDGDATILHEVARRARAGKGPLVVATAATTLPDELAGDYRKVFRRLGVRHVAHLDVRSREDAETAANVRKVEDAAVLFFTGGDQLRITSQIGDSAVYRCMAERYRRGLTIAGTSAGAAAMPETMLIAGPGDETPELTSLGMAPGLGLLPNTVVDTHFSERGRLPRLLGAVAQNPRNLGIGIDEDTAIVVEDGASFRVLGSGAVYVVDGAGITYSSLSERRARGVIAVHDARLHVLGDGGCFDLAERRPVDGKNDTKE